MPRCGMPSAPPAMPPASPKWKTSSRSTPASTLMSDAREGGTGITPVPQTPPPRILVVSGEQWPRALLRAQLDEAGYDAIGAGTLSQALRHPPDDAERGPVRLVVVDSGAGAEPEALEQARRRYPGVPFVLVHRAGAVPPGPWAAILRRPVTIGDIVATVGRLVPLA